MSILLESSGSRGIHMDDVSVSESVLEVTYNVWKRMNETILTPLSFQT